MLMFKNIKYKNVQAKFKVECAFKELKAAEDNFIVKKTKKRRFFPP